MIQKNLADCFAINDCTIFSRARSAVVSALTTFWWTSRYVTHQIHFVFVYHHSHVEEISFHYRFGCHPLFSLRKAFFDSIFCRWELWSFRSVLRVDRLCDSPSVMSLPPIYVESLMLEICAHIFGRHALARISPHVDTVGQASALSFLSSFIDEVFRYLLSSFFMAVKRHLKLFSHFQPKIHQRQSRRDRKSARERNWKRFLRSMQSGFCGAGTFCSAAYLDVCTQS